MAGAVTVSYKVNGIDKGLKLDGATIADIFLGKITKWNDPAIAKLNSGASLPGTAITVCHRSDESGTTKNFTEFLSDYSTAWKSGPGSDKSVKWPTGTGAKGNDGVAACIKQTDGAVGYVEQAYALQNNFTYASVKNKSGAFVAPTLDAAVGGGRGRQVPADLRFSTINAPAPTAYPITATTFLLVYQDMCKAGVAPQTRRSSRTGSTTRWATGRAWPSSSSTPPLPANVKSKAQAKVDGLQCNGSALKG